MALLDMNAAPLPGVGLYVVVVARAPVVEHAERHDVAAALIAQAVGQVVSSPLPSISIPDGRR